MTGPDTRPGPSLEVLDTADQLAWTVTAKLLEVVVTAQRARGTASLLLTGGRVMKQVLTALSSEAGPREAIDWPHVDIWWGDERWVPSGTPGAEGRNDVEFDPVVAAVALDPARVHRMPGSQDFASPEEAAHAYATALAASAHERGEDGPVPHFDVALLGVGEDGHCASLFPGHPATGVTDASVVAVYDSPKPPRVRLSLTFPALDSAEQIWFVTAGDGKADAVKAALSGGSRPTEVPSSAPRGRAATRWLIDAAAASALPTGFSGPGS